MKIIFNVPDLLSGKGGAERVAVELANQLTGLGHSVALLCTARDKPASYQVDERVRIITTPSMSNPRGQRVALDKCREFQPNVYFFFYSNGKIVEQYAIGKRLGVPMGAQECTNPLRCIRNIATDLEISVEEATTLRTAILADMAAIRMTMNHYVDSVPSFIRQNVFSFKNSFPNIRPSEPAVSDGKNWFINVSGLGKKNKNGLALIRALPYVVKRHANWGALFVGSSSNRKRAMELALELGIAEHLKIVESVDDINPFYSSAAFHVICSFEEGCPNAVCEAMILGLASIGFDDCEGTRQLINHNKNGLLVSRSGGETALGEAICQLIDNEVLRQSLGAEAQREAKHFFDSAHIYATWLEMLNHISSAAIDLHNVPTQRQRELAYFLGRFMENHFTENGKYFVPTVGPSVDFIVPLYNKREEIQRTMTSILSCKYPSYRIIVVDDQSTDGSYEFVLKTYGAHPLVKIVQRENNGGLSSARNTGLSLSNATFVQFWDADDIYYGEALGRLVEVAVAGDSDIVTGLAERDGNVLPAYRLSQLNAYALKQPFCHLAFQTMSSCFKLYRREFLIKNELNFVDGLFMQDTELNLRAFSAARSVSMANVIVGEYIDAGPNRGSQHVSEARMRSAIEIFERNRIVNDSEQGTSVNRDYADFIILKFVFRFFIAKLLSPELFERFFDVHSVDHSHYLEKFRECVNQMTPGIRRLFESSEKNDWRWAMAFSFMQLNDDESALHAIRINGPDTNWFEKSAKVLSNHLDLDPNHILNRVTMIGHI